MMNMDRARSSAMGAAGKSGNWRLAALILGASSLGGHMGFAQSAKPALTVPELRVCICQEQTIAAMRATTADKDAAYKERTDQVKGLTAQIDQMTATMNPTDSMAQDQLSELIDLRSRVQQQIRERALPALQQATNALNLQVQSYNANCANRTIYDTDDAEARKNLNCPAP
jgi:hypothetical protein